MPREQHLVCDLFIIESLETNEFHDGWNLANRLRDIGKNPIYIGVSNIDEFRKALELFNVSKYRFLHISCHGDNSNVVFSGSGNITYSNFAELTRDYLKGKRVFFSACQLGNELFSNELVMRNKGIQSIIAPICDIEFQDAAFVLNSLFISIFKTKFSPITGTHVYPQNIELTEIKRILGKIISIHKQPFHISRYDPSQDRVDHFKLIPENAVRHDYFYKVEAYSHIRLR